MNSRVTQEMFLSKMSMQEPKCSSQGGRASEHGQWGKKNEKSPTGKFQGTRNLIATKN